jgi:hypothetical protein
MGNDAKTILDLENQVIVELGFSMATVAERMLRHPDRLRGARSEAERIFIRRETARVLERLIGTTEVAFAVLDDYRPFFKKEITMPNWMKIVISIAGTAGVVAGSIASGGTLPVAIALGASSFTGSIAAFFHPGPAKNE